MTPKRIKIVGITPCQKKPGWTNFLANGWTQTVSGLNITNPWWPGGPAITASVELNNKGWRIDLYINETPKISQTVLLMKIYRILNTVIVMYIGLRQNNPDPEKTYFNQF